MEIDDCCSLDHYLYQHNINYVNELIKENYSWSQPKHLGKRLRQNTLLWGNYLTSITKCVNCFGIVKLLVDVECTLCVYTELCLKGERKTDCEYISTHCRFL